MSIEKRYLTSDLVIRAQVSLIFCIGMTSITDNQSLLLGACGPAIGSQSAGAPVEPSILMAQAKAPIQKLSGSVQFDEEPLILLEVSGE